jgi:hypothetical protein
MRVRKKPIIIEAAQYVPGEQLVEPWVMQGLLDYIITEGINELTINTYEGVMVCKPFDYIMRGIDGELYPCAKSIFERTYDIL